MRRALTLVTTILLAALSFGQTVITRTLETPRNERVAGSRVIDTQSGLKIELDAQALALIGGVQKDGSPETKDAIRRITALIDAANAGLVSVAEFISVDWSSMSSDQRVTRSTPIINRMGNAFSVLDVAADQDNPRLRKLIDDALDLLPRDLPGLEGTVIEAAAAFRAASAYAQEERARLIAESLNASIMLLHLRDSDSSIRREVRFLEGFTSTDKENWEKLKTLGSNVAGDPNKLFKEFEKKIIALANTALAEFKNELQAEINRIQEELDAILAPINEAAAKNKDKYGKLAVNYKTVKQQLELIPKNFESLRQKIIDLSLQSDHDPAPVVSTILSDVKTLLLDVSKALNGASEFFEGVERALQDATEDFETALGESVSQLRQLWPRLATSFAGVVGRADTQFVQTHTAVLHMLNFASDMRAIGSATGPFPSNGMVEYVNDGGVLTSTNGGGDKMKLTSGDELLFQVTIKAPGQGENDTPKTAASRRFYVYKIGLRTDRLFLLGASPGVGSDAWRLSPTWADVYTKGTRSSLEANRTRAIGFGLAVSTMDLDLNGQYELGTAAALSFLDGRLVLGHGWNLGIGRNYWLVGWRFRMN